MSIRISKETGSITKDCSIIIQPDYALGLRGNISVTWFVNTVHDGRAPFVPQSGEVRLFVSDDNINWRMCDNGAIAYTVNNILPKQGYERPSFSNIFPKYIMFDVIGMAGFEYDLNVYSEGYN